MSLLWYGLRIDEGGEDTMSKKLQKYWRQQGVKAGKTEGWMNLEETLSEDIEHHPQFTRDAGELVQTGIEGWEETDHFQILYGSKMAADARDEVKADYLNDEAIEKWQDYKEAFWEGYLEGRMKIGVDVYKVANSLLAKTKGRKSVTKSRPRKQSPSKQLSLKGLRR